MLLAGLYGCPGSSKSGESTGKIKVTDFRGKKLVLTEPPQKVVCLIESALSGIYMLGQQDRVVGVPSGVYDKELYRYYSRLDERIKEQTLPTPGDWDFISLEEILELDPDLVMIWASQSEAIASLEQFGIPVYAIMLHSFEDVYKEIRDFGKIMACEERADSIIQYTTKTLETLSEEYSSSSETKSAYFMWSQGVNETSGTNSTVTQLFHAAGVRNACNLSSEHVTVSIEKIYDWDPDMIVMWHNKVLDTEDVLNNPLLHGLRAVQNGQVYELPEVFSCDFWTLKMQYPARLIAEWAYAEKDEPKKLEKELKKMYEVLYGKNLME
jgi:iron complex transport system substrate-binding protein